MVNTSLGFEYLYIFDNGLSVGANTSFISESLLDITNTTPQITSDYTGNGISFAPAIGWTFRGEVSHIQLLFYPLIMESASYDERTITVRNVTSPKLKTETYLDTYKTGIASTFEWGWEHFKLGAGAGANLIFADNYNEKIESAHGLEVVFMGKATILF